MNEWNYCEQQCANISFSKHLLPEGQKSSEHFLPIKFAGAPPACILMGWPPLAQVGR
jgi:hypothetical protein